MYCRLWPTYALAHNNLAAVLGEESPKEAEQHLKLALRIDPGHANSLYNFAFILRSVIKIFTRSFGGLIK